MSTPHFWEVVSLAVDGDVYAQPLYVPAVEVPGQGTLNVIFVATEHGRVWLVDGP
jgi:hypothetical protein